MTSGHDGPFDVVLLDVNGTLVPSRFDGSLDAGAVGRFRGLVEQLTSTGVAVGLCSDSPLEQLWEFGHEFGLGEVAEFPVVAENGNVIAVGGAVRVIAPFPARERIRSEVADVAAEHGLRRVVDVTAVEFGGRRPVGREWAFGANRRASVSVFGPADFVRDAGRSVNAWSAANGVSVSVEFSPNASYAGIHPYRDIDRGKSRALARLVEAEPKRILMVGNSAADWIPDVPGVRCAFVADTSVPLDARVGAWHLSQKPDLEGVIDILDQVIRGRIPSPITDRA